ncbi:MAG: hypothetical protein RMK20_11610 [Verrucomicrobiales bacterium]|nr:hypothetical protein [Verrucomicrobiales bacterium]
MKTERLTCWRRALTRARHAITQHPLRCASVGLAVVGVALATGLLVQRLLAASPLAADVLEGAIELYQEGAPKEALALLAAIPPEDPNYPQARAYEALCRYELCRTGATNDWRGCLDALQTARAVASKLPAALQEQLALNQIDALYRSRRLDSPKALTVLAEFQAAFPGSPHANALREYELATQLEIGFGRVYDAALGEHKPFYKTWTNGLAHLTAFVQRFNELPANDYATLQDRSLAEDTQLALALLSQNPDAVSSVATRDPVKAVKLALVQLGLEQKLRPETWEQNLRRMAACQAAIQNLVPSHDRARLMRHLTRFGLRTGQRLWAEAAGIPPEHAQEALLKRTVARRYFDAARQLHHQFVAQERSRTSPTDMALSWIELFETYYLEGDAATLAALTATLLTNSAPGTLNWLAARLYQGVALAEQSPPQPQAAAAAFDTVMAAGFKGIQKNDVYDHLLLSAARWRIHLAYQHGDTAIAVRTLDWVEAGNGSPQLREKFLEQHAWVRRWAEAKGG